MVENGSPGSCELFVDDQYLLKVTGRTTTLVENLPGTPYALTARCAEDAHRFDVAPEEDRVQTVAIPGAGGELTDRTAMLSLKNDSPFDLEVALAGDRLGNVFARSSGIFRHCPVGSHELTLTESRSRGRWTVPVELTHLSVTRLAPVLPGAMLEIANDSRETVSVEVLSHRLRLTAGETAELAEVPPGTLAVKVRYVDSGRDLVQTVTAPPGSRESLRLSDRAGNLRVENRMEQTATLLLKGEEFAKLQPGQTKVLRGLAPGRVELRAELDNERVYQQEFIIVPEATETWLLNAGNSQLMVHNLVGEEVQILLDGHRLLSLAPLAAARLPVTPGAHEVSALCEITGHVDKRQVDIAGGLLQTVSFGPQPGRLLVENRTLDDLKLFRNGKSLSPVAAGAVTEYSAQPLGRNLIEALDPSGNIVLRQDVVVSPRSEGGARLVVGSSFLRVRVTNHTGEGVRIDPDVEAEAPILEPGGQAVLQVKGISGVVKFLGATSSTRYDRRIEGQPGQSVDVTLEPISGGIAVENTTEEDLTIELNRESLGLLPAGENLFRDGVPPGDHTLIARRGEEVVRDVTCHLQADSWYVWRLTEERGGLRVVNRTGEDLLLTRNGSPAGRLLDGLQATLKDLPEDLVTVEAQGAATNQTHRFTFRPEPATTATWLIRSATGNVAVKGLSGRRAKVYVDGTLQATTTGEEPEPLVIPLPPGEHVVRALFEDSSSMAAIVRVTANLSSHLHLGGGHPEVEVRNRSSAEVVILVNNLQLSSLAANQELVITLDRPGLHTIRVESRDGTRIWLLKDVFFRQTGRFGWTLSE